jgi:hypothetical protein
VAVYEDFREEEYKTYGQKRAVNWEMIINAGCRVEPGYKHLLWSLGGKIRFCLF